jgi:hypothetical protein
VRIVYLDGGQIVYPDSVQINCPYPYG